MQEELIHKTFTYHSPFGDQPERYKRIRQMALDFARLIKDSCPESREKSLAFTDLQRCVMMANAAIAIHEVEK